MLKRLIVLSVILFVFVVSLSMLGCSHSLHISHVSDFAPTYKDIKSGRMIKGHGEQFVILGFVTQTDFVEQAYQSLQRECPNGNIQGITTQYTTDHGFLSWTNRIDMRALCI